MNELTSYYVIDGSSIIHEDEFNPDEYQQNYIANFSMPVEFDDSDVYMCLFMEGHVT